MAENSAIEWTDHTFNPWIGCTKVSPGCDHCYAEQRMDTRLHVVNWGAGQPRKRTSATNWKEPIRWNKQHDAFFAKHGRRQRVFCASLADVFDNEVPDEWRADLFRLIERTPNLDWLLLTKRIGNVTRMVLDATDLIDYGEGWQSLWGQGRWPENVWLGASIVNREEMLRDGPKLKAVPAAVTFWSCEPLLGDLGEIPRDLLPDWVIPGGESGPGARPMHPDWPRNLRDQCHAAGVKFLFKQWGEWQTVYARSDGTPVFRQFDNFQQWVNKASSWVNGGICLDRRGRELKNGADMARARDEDAFPVTIMHKVGKKAAGRLLDGVQHDGYPGDQQ